MRTPGPDVADDPAPRSGFVTTIGWLGIVAGTLTLLAGALMAYVLDALLADPDIEADLARLAVDPHLPGPLGWLVAHPSALYLATLAFGAAVVVVAIALLRRRNWGRLGMLVVLWLGVIVNVAIAAATVLVVQAIPDGVAKGVGEFGVDFDRIAWGVMATVVGGVTIIVALHAWVIQRLKATDECD